MREEQKLRMIEEIRQMERDLYLKRSLLASCQTDESFSAEADRKRLRGHFTKLITDIGSLSKGGNSVEDQKAERER
jgi:hypothetical protein